MLISVIMPVYNSSNYIDEAIQSILRQDFHNFELIIVNDCSRDNSAEVISHYTDKRIKIINNHLNEGVTKSLNKGILISKGEYIAIMHSDDIAKSNRLAEQYAFMEKNKQIGLIGSNVEIIDTYGKVVNLILKPVDSQLILKNIWIYNPIVSPTFFFRRTVLKKVGYFNESLRLVEDFDFILRCAISGVKMSNIDKVLLQYRQHQNQLSGFQRKEVIQFFSLFLKYRPYFKLNIKDYIFIFAKVFLGLLLPRKIISLISSYVKTKIS